MSRDADEKQGSGWWKPILVALGAAAAGVVAWGWLQPAAEEPSLSLTASRYSTLMA